MSLSRADIEAGLHKLGVRRGDALEVHSSLSSFGRVEGGAAAVVDALMAAVGEEGALVMSAYPLSMAVPLTEEEKARGLQYKVKLLPPDSPGKTGMGAVADEFRRRPGVALGSGIHRVAAWGREAGRHAREGYRYLLETGGLALLMGVGIYRCSSMHQAEGRVPLPREISARFETPEDVLRDYPEDKWAVGFGSAPLLPWNSVWNEARAKGVVREGRIGLATCYLFRASAMVDIYENRLKTDPFELYGLPRTDG